MTERLFLVEQPEHAVGFKHLNASVVSSAAALAKSYVGNPRDAMWIAPHAGCIGPLAALIASPAGRAANRGLLLFERVSAARRAFLQERFERIVEPGDGLKLLPIEELVEVLASPDRQDLAIGVAVDAEDQAVVVYRGDLTSVVVPLASFSNTGSGPKADPTDFAVTDYGQTIRLGAFEAAVDALLYECDADYRKRAKARRLELDDSLGAAIKRLRFQKGLGRGDFKGITDKEMARIERGEVKKPHKDTLERIAKTLGVEVDDLRSY